MPRYLVESYVASSASAVDHARACAREVGGYGAGVRYVRTTYVPGDEIALHVFESPSAEVLADASRTVGLAFERIVQAIDEPVEEPAERRLPPR